MNNLREFRRVARLMGSAFEFIVVAEEGSGETLLDHCVNEVKRIEFILTEFSETSQTALINKSAGLSPATVDDEVYQLIKRCKDISKLTQGSFDITAGVFRGLYKFNQENFEFPSPEEIKEKKKYVGYEKISLLPQHKVFLTQKGMRIGFGGIGKGYAADRVRMMLLKEGVQHAVINASGDLTAWGERLDGEPWKVAIANPDDKQKIIAWLPVHNASVATSGDYEQFFIHNGVRYSHTIDPKTGRPVRGIKSVTLVSPSAELSDALATAVSTMGIEVGLHFVNQLPQTHTLIIDENNKVFNSKKLNLNLVS